MQLTLHARIRDALRFALEKRWRIEAPEIVLNQTPKVEFGELATPLCLSLSKALKKAPRVIAEEILETLKIEGIHKMSIAGPGYINFYLDRATILGQSMAEFRNSKFEGFPKSNGKVIVEHTNINPNKAAHIGHLRNAAIGDSFVRTLRFSGSEVEVQNYIDNTGVQVADVIVGFRFIENHSVETVRELINDPGTKFDYYCWDLYAKAASFYETQDPEHTKRTETLQEIERGDNETAAMAEEVAMAIVRCHLRTMDRINVRYDLLPRESDILHLKFWDKAFSLLKAKKAIFFEEHGKNQGCWVMRLETESGTEEKIIVRSNQTVTYVGKDIAYQLWKLGLLNCDFNYTTVEYDSQRTPVWATTSSKVTLEEDHPAFGRGVAVYNVIDVRQSYPQTVVREGVRLLGYEDAAERSVHFSYEMVALTPACAVQLGIELSDEDQGKTYVEVSGRKGQGVKADDLLNTLEEKAYEEVRKRHPDFDKTEQADIAHQIAVSALRYFLLRFTRTSVIAFDFDEALSFDGETGPYIQYATVRAKNIFRRMEADHPDFSLSQLDKILGSDKLPGLLDESDDLWELIYTASRLDEIAGQVTSSLEPATMAKFSFTLAQKFNVFYHKYRVLSEKDRERQMFYLLVVDFVRQSLTRALDLMGISVPDRM